MQEKHGKRNAFDMALYYITIKNRTTKEIFDKLKSKDYSDTEIEEAIFKLREYKYIDDSNYMDMYVRDNIEKKGINRIKKELAQKGIDDYILANLDMSSFNEEMDYVYNMLLKRFINIDYKNPKERNRVVGYFARRGYCFSSISSAIRKLNSDINCE